MKVFKFGGASISDASAIKNMASIIRSYAGERLVVVVSAMGKTTNHLEDIIFKKLSGKTPHAEINALKSYHHQIAKDLFDSHHEVFTHIDSYINRLNDALQYDYPYNKYYDQVVAHGELMSSAIIALYLKQCGVNTQWLDARTCIRTNDHYRFAQVNWPVTGELIKKQLALIPANELVITQGFIGQTDDEFTTTLGREGSDFTGAIFASALNAESLTVWKDVPGILNADPKLISNAELFSELPYKEAAEMTYYGAKVIHPQTIRPLANQGIPLYVRSFTNPHEPGTIIHDCSTDHIKPTIIIKKDQCLLSFHVLDYTFVDENNLSRIFEVLASHDIKINIMQNSAISFSIVIDNEVDKVKGLLLTLQGEFSIRYNTNLTLITIKNYNSALVDSYRNNQNILLEQISRSNYRLLIGDNL